MLFNELFRIKFSLKINYLLRKVVYIILILKTIHSMEFFENSTAGKQTNNYFLITLTKQHYNLTKQQQKEKKN